MNNEALDRLRVPAAWALLGAVAAQMLGGVISIIGDSSHTASTVPSTAGAVPGAMVSAGPSFYGPFVLGLIAVAVLVVVTAPQKSSANQGVVITAMILTGVSAVMALANLIAGFVWGAGIGALALGFGNALEVLGTGAVIGVGGWVLLKVFGDRNLVPRPAPAPMGQPAMGQPGQPQGFPPQTGAQQSFAPQAGQQPYAQQGYATGGQPAYQQQPQQGDWSAQPGTTDPGQQQYAAQTGQGFATGQYQQPQQPDWGAQQGAVDPTQQGQQGYADPNQQQGAVDPDMQQTFIAQTPQAFAEMGQQQGGVDPNTQQTYVDPGQQGQTGYGQNWPAAGDPYGQQSGGQPSYGQQQAGYDPYGSQQAPSYGTGGQPGYGTGGQAAYGTGGQPGYGTGGQAAYGTGGQPAYGTGGQPSYGTGGQPGYDPGQYAPQSPSEGERAAQDAIQYGWYQQAEQPQADPRRDSPMDKFFTSDEQPTAVDGVPLADQGYPGQYGYGADQQGQPGTGTPDSQPSWYRDDDRR